MFGFGKKNKNKEQILEIKPVKPLPISNPDNLFKEIDEINKLSELEVEARKKNKITKSDDIEKRTESDQ